MKFHHFIFMLSFVFLACSKSTEPVLLYSNEFSESEDLAEFSIYNDTDCSLGDPSNNKWEIADCLNVSIHCAALLSVEFGPFDQDYNLYMQCDIQSQWGSELQMNLLDNPAERVLIESEEYESAEVRWRTYTSEFLFVPSGEKVMLYINPSSRYFTYAYFDNLYVYGTN